MQIVVVVTFIDIFRAAHYNLAKFNRLAFVCDSTRINSAGKYLDFGRFGEVDIRRVAQPCANDSLVPAPEVSDSSHLVEQLCIDGHERKSQRVREEKINKTLSPLV